MEVIVALLVTLTTSLGLPILLDTKLFKINAPWPLIFLSYLIMVCGCLVMPLFLNNSSIIWIDRVTPALSVLAALLIARISLSGVSIVLLFSTILLPFYVLYEITAYNNVNNPFEFVFFKLDLWFVAPFLFGITSWFVVSHITQACSGQGKRE